MILPAHERWRFSLADGSVHDVFPQPLFCLLCEQPHWWFVNRDGKTRCVQCDLMLLQTLIALPAPPAVGRRTATGAVQ